MMKRFEPIEPSARAIVTLVILGAAMVALLLVLWARAAWGAESRVTPPLPGTLADKLLTDGAVASLVADRLLELKPDIDPSLAYSISSSTARWSRNYGVRWQVVVAICWTESRFVPTATGRRGERGLMQILRGGSYGVDENIRQGCEHYHFNLAAANGDEAKALRFYNGSWSYSKKVLEVAK